MARLTLISDGYAKYYRQRELEACREDLKDPLPWAEAVELFGLADKQRDPRWPEWNADQWPYLEYEPQEGSDAAGKRQE